ncbi:glycosyltransferase [Chitinophaga niastensis]|uniref:glycosyltransferase n=1 Tax=Chitinophaga niastensis TaxID=536980 RepID=UPI001304CFAD|nr:glycosyltransferase family 4 protein [Chitinophaga niastensis]
MSGTVAYVYELAIGLKAQGYNVEVYTYKAGKTAKDLRAKGINVTTDLKQLRNIPNIIHAHHNLTTIDVLRRFKNVPVIYFMHDRVSPYDIPIISNQILKYIAVDYNCLDRLCIDAGIPEEYTGVIYNWVNVNRFKLREDFAARPSRALVFSNYAKKDNYYKVIAEACKEQGLHLDVIGVGTGNYVKEPAERLMKYDLVFAKAKAAMEALSTGAAVVLCDFHGLGEIVDPANLTHLRKFNFGMKTLNRSFDVALIMAEINKYNADNNRQNAAWIRENASFSKVLDQLIQLYDQTIKDYAHDVRGLPGNAAHSWLLKYRLKIRCSLPVRAVYKLIRTSKAFITN